LHAGKPNWYVVVSKPRQEKTALENLQYQGFECFLPLAENPYQRRKKSRQPAEPLFPRYLFLHANSQQQNLAPVRSTKGVLNMVRFGLQLAVVPPSIIQALKARRATDTGLIKLTPDPMQPGENVTVFDGPLAGLTGILKQHSSETRALLLLKLLGRETTVEVDSLLLQKAR